MHLVLRIDMEFKKREGLIDAIFAAVRDRGDAENACERRKL